jgi:hypothetical protein
MPRKPRNDDSASTKTPKLVPIPTDLAPTKGKRWTDAEDALLVPVLQLGKLKGRGTDASFQTDVFQDAARQLIAAGYNRQPDQCHSRYTRVRPLSCPLCMHRFHDLLLLQLRGDWKIFHAIASLSGFGWDSLENVVVAGDPLVWETYAHVCYWTTMGKRSDHVYSHERRDQRELRE